MRGLRGKSARIAEKTNYKNETSSSSETKGLKDEERYTPRLPFYKRKMTDGTVYKTRSTYGKTDENLNLEIDPLTHPAWTGGSQKLLIPGEEFQSSRKV